MIVDYGGRVANVQSRILAQIVYYFRSYFLLAQTSSINIGDKVKFVIPTGNYGLWSFSKLHQKDYGKLSGVISDRNGRQRARGIPRYKDGPACG